MTDLDEHPFPYAYTINVVAFLISQVLFLPVMGRAADRFNRKNLMIFCLIVSIGFFPPAMYYIGNFRSVIGTFFILLVWGIISETYYIAMMVWIVGVFPPEFRVTAVAVGYNFSQAIFGGMSSALATILYNVGGVTATGFLISAIATLSLLGVMIAPKRRYNNATAEELETPLLLDEEFTEL